MSLAGKEWTIIYVRGLGEKKEKKIVSGPVTRWKSSTVPGSQNWRSVAGAVSGRPSSKRPLIHAANTAALPRVEDLQPISDVALGANNPGDPLSRGNPVTH